jgi:hypothetical protein
VRKDEKKDIPIVIVSFWAFLLTSYHALDVFEYSANALTLTEVCGPLLLIGSIQVYYEGISWFLYVWKRMGLAASMLFVFCHLLLRLDGTGN